MRDLTERQAEEARELARELRQTLGSWASSNKVSEYLSVDRAKLLELAASGEFRASRLGPKCYRIHVGSLAEMLVRRKV